MLPNRRNGCTIGFTNYLLCIRILLTKLSSLTATQLKNPYRILIYPYNEPDCHFIFQSPFDDLIIARGNVPKTLKHKYPEETASELRRGVSRSYWFSVGSKGT